MTFDLNAKNANEQAKKVYRKLRAVHVELSTIATKVAADDYTMMLVNVPPSNLGLQQIVTAALDLGITAQIISEMNNLYNSTYTAAEIQQFVTNYNDFAVDLEANLDRFEVSYNPTNKRLQFTTPIPANVKTALTNRINAVLALVVNSA